MKASHTLSVHAVVIAGVCAINLLLFSVVPAMREAVITRRDTTARNRVRVVADVIPPKKEKPKPTKKRIRNIRSPSTRGMSERMQLKFAPDLGIAGGQGVAVEQQDFEAMVFEEGETDVDARPTHRVPPEYPSRARMDGVEGQVVAVFVVNERGRVETVNIVESPHPALADACRKALRQWRFKPASNKGVPVKMRFRARFPFVLEG